MSTLAGQVVIVTGGARRIGRALALACAQAGASVAVTYRRSQVEAQATVAELHAAGAYASAVFCDLDAPESIREAIEAVVERHGRLDILINNAGQFASAPLEDLTLEQWDGMFASNARGPFLMAQAALPHLRRACGRIVNLGSLGGLAPWPKHGHYCASKAALHMLSRTMAKAWAPEVAVNCVAPGMIELDGADAAGRHLAERTPMRRNGTAADVVSAVLFFCSAPHFITGQVLTVDGGLGL